MGLHADRGGNLGNGELVAVAIVQQLHGAREPSRWCLRWPSQPGIHGAEQLHAQRIERECRHLDRAGRADPHGEGVLHG